MPHEDKNTLFPVFLKLESLQTLIVGGGAVGLEKLTAVLQNAPAAPVLLVGAVIRSEIKTLAENAPNVELVEREFVPADLEDRDLVIIATENAHTNAEIRDLAKAKKILSNVADTPALCDFYLSSVVQKGSMKIAISTNGKSPTIAKRLRELLTDLLPDELEDILSHLGIIRQKLKGDFAEKVKKLNKITSVLVDRD